MPNLDVRVAQGMETWLLAVHLGCVHVACGVIGMKVTHADLAEMLSRLHGNHISEEMAASLVHHIMDTMLQAL